jgi:hypothetical protein
VRFEKAVLDEPFGYNLSAGDRVMPLGDTTLRLTSDHYGIELQVDRDEKGVVFLPPAGVRRVFVALLRNGSSCFSGVATTPEAGATLALGPAAACRLEGGARGPAGGKGEVSLTPEQLERLKSLGYVQ